MEDKTFVFGTPVTGINFTDRKTETKRLQANFTHGVNTILISPRRWGKSSLVRHVIETIDNPEIKIVYIDVFACRNPEEFYARFASGIIRQTSSRQEEWLENIKSFLGRFNPKFSISLDSKVDFTLSLEMLPKAEDAEEILNIPEKIAQKKNCRIVVCIDEFQQIGEFKDSVYFQKKLRTVWQYQQHTSYCLFGSKKHLMSELFNQVSLPFYKFGDIIFLDKIPAQDWIDFIQSRFEGSGKIISDSIALQICRLVENQSNYVQQLSWILWVNTEKEASEKTLEASYNEMINHNSLLFEQMTESLSAYQLNFLKAVAAGETKEFSSNRIIQEFRLGSSANIKRIKDALLKKDLIETSRSEVTIPDPIFREWIRRLR